MEPLNNLHILPYFDLNQTNFTVCSLVVGHYRFTFPTIDSLSQIEYIEISYFFADNGRQKVYLHPSINVRRHLHQSCGIVESFG